MNTDTTLVKASRRPFLGVHGETMSVSHELVEIIKVIKDYEKSPAKFISREDILTLREQLADWMLVIVQKTKLSDACYFLAIRTFDKFLENAQELVEPEDLQIIAVTCLILASKYEETRFIGLEFAMRGICHGKFTKSQFKNCKLIILKTLNFEMRNAHFEDFVSEILNHITKGPDEAFADAIPFLKKSTIFVYKLLVQHYFVFRGINLRTLYFSIVYFCLNNGMRLNRSKASFQMFKFFEIADMFQVKMKDILDMDKIIKEVYKNFEKRPEEREYLFKFEYSKIATSA